MGDKVNETCRKHGISDATFYRWKSQFSGMTVSYLARLRELVAGNTKHMCHPRHVPSLFRQIENRQTTHPGSRFF
jgi:hypothetical protein